MSIILAFALREHARRAGWAIACVALVLLAGRSLAQTLVWQDDLALFGNAAAVNPRSLAAHNGVAQAYQRAGNDTRALEHFQRAMIIAPEHPTAYESAALLHARRGEWQRAVEAMEHALTVRPQWPGFDPHRAADDHVRLGQILLMSGQHARAVAHGEAALRLDPGNELAQQLFKDAKHAAGPSGQP